MATATKTRAKAGTAATVPRIDGRMRFNWLQDYRATIAYNGDECVLTVPKGNRKFMGATLAEAVNHGIAAFPLKAGK